MIYKTGTRNEILRRALRYAIDYNDGLIDAHTNKFWPDYSSEEFCSPESAEFAAQWRRENEDFRRLHEALGRGE